MFSVIQNDGRLVVSMLAFYTDNSSSNPAEVDSFSSFKMSF